jgi:hypothetical protein
MITFYFNKFKTDIIQLTQQGNGDSACSLHLPVVQCHLLPYSCYDDDDGDGVALLRYHLLHLYYSVFLGRTAFSIAAVVLRNLGPGSS